MRNPTASEFLIDRLIRYRVLLGEPIKVILDGRVTDGANLRGSSEAPECQV
jgi:hypothetical protein